MNSSANGSYIGKATSEPANRCMNEFGIVGWREAMNELFLTLFVMLLFLTGITAG